jgi:hypothetical protein
MELHAQEVQTVELYTSDVHPLNARLGSACLVQLPVEPVATNVGDPAMWLVEKSEKLVSIKPVQDAALETNLAIVTRQGTLNFSVRPVPAAESFTQMVRVTKIIDDSKPFPPQSQPPESFAETVIREIRVAQNYYALKFAGSPELRNVEQWTVMRGDEATTHSITFLQTFRFRDSRHVLLHFLTVNRTEAAVSFAPRKTIVRLGDTFFAPVAVSLGRTTLPPGRSAENFVILDGASGLSHRQEFEIFLPATSSPILSNACPPSAGIERPASIPAQPFPL